MKSSTLSIIAGVLALIGGIVALIFPLPAGLALTVFVGWAFIVSGAVALWAGFSDGDLPDRWWVFAVGLLELVLGIWILANPLGGLVSLTIIVGILLILSGVGRFVFAMAARGTPGFWLFILSAVLSVGLGLYALIALDHAAALLPGTLVAVELLSIGVAFVSVGIFMKRNTGL